MTGDKLAKSKNKWLNRFKKWHRWPSLVFGFFFVCWAISGIVLNHRGLFSPLEMSRQWMAREYRYENWNNAAVKGDLHLSPDSVLIFGNIGIWLADGRLENFRDYNQGFPAGIDNRKILSMLKTAKGNLYAGTLFGLYYFDEKQEAWKKIGTIPEKEQVTSLMEKDGQVHVLTRSRLYLSPDDPLDFHPEKLILPPPEGYDNKAGLFKTIWVIHSGEIYGDAGKLIVDLMGIGVIVLTVTGVIHFVAPYVMRRKKKRRKNLQTITGMKRWSRSLHKQAGIALVVFLLINTTTGMFLRPPFLIAIATSRVPRIPYSHLDTPNAWYDKLRGIIYDEEAGGYLVATVDGIYYAGQDLSEPLRPLPGQPPVSVMGINVFEKTGRGRYLVGSFNGLFDWMPWQGAAINRITGEPPAYASNAGRPLSEHMVSGLVSTSSGDKYYLDYNRGAIPLNTVRKMTAMPPDILDKSPMSWWNFALEVHTARFFKFMFGNFYILFIPIFGISSTVLLLAGLGIWIKLFYRKRKGRSRSGENREAKKCSENEIATANS